MIKLLFNTLSIYLCIRILKNQNYGIGINHSQRHFFYYHTSTPIGRVFKICLKSDAFIP